MNEPASGPAQDSPNAVEQRDRALFDRIAADYCRKDLVPASRLARRQRLRRTLTAIPATNGISILEAGCGAGFSAAHLRGCYATYHGIDYSEQLIRYAQLHNGSREATFEVANIHTYRPRRLFDVVLMIGVLHHLDRLDEALRGMVGWLKPGGWLAANEPHPGNPLVRAARLVRKRVDSSYSSAQRELSANQLRAALEAAGFVDVRIRPQGLFSTPFAEVVLRPQAATYPVSAIACWADSALEAILGRALRCATWNLVAAGRRPGEGR